MVIRVKLKNVLYNIDQNNIRENVFLDAYPIILFWLVIFIIISWKLGLYRIQNKSWNQNFTSWSCRAFTVLLRFTSWIRLIKYGILKTLSTISNWKMYKYLRKIVIEDTGIHDTFVKDKNCRNSITCDRHIMFDR